MVALLEKPLEVNLYGNAKCSNIYVADAFSMMMILHHNYDTLRINNGVYRTTSWPPIWDIQIEKLIHRPAPVLEYGRSACI